MTLVDDLQWRGLIQDSTSLDELRPLLDGVPMAFYVGFDPTAASLHVGHLMQVLTARRLQLAGHRPLLLVGGATGQIGDPRESSERTLNAPEVVAAWRQRIHDQLAPFVTYEGDNAATLVDNLDWTGPMSVVEFLRDVGKHFPVNKMLARDVVRNRLESGISFTEFSYQLLQANDFYELHRRHACRLQFGGSDQWGNITAGVDYVRRRGAGPVQAFTTPLVLNSDGSKFGKSDSGGQTWLDPQMTSPYAFYQFWINADDRDVSNYLRYFSFRSRAELEELEKATAERPQARLAQRALAEEITALVHGQFEADQAIAASQALFGRGSLESLSPETLRASLSSASLITVSELPTVAALLQQAGLVKSGGEARRTVAEGGAYVNNERVTDAEAVVPESALLHGRFLVLRRGKRTFAGVELQS